jgi:RES domain-containing protein
MPSGWRIQRAKYAATAFSGEGARRYRGRWNSRGVPVVYLSAHQSLSAREVIVRAQPLSLLNEHVVVGAEWDEAITETFAAHRLPTGWRASPALPATVEIGDRWLREARSAVLAVPSAIIPAETNFLLNPAHPDFARIRIRKPEPFVFDPRLLNR